MSHKMPMEMLVSVPVRAVLVAAIAVLAMGAALSLTSPAVAQGTEMSLEFADRPHHAGKSFQVTLSGLNPNQSGRISECVDDQTGDQCSPGWGWEAGQRGTDATIRLAGTRWHAVDGGIVDCAVVPCSIELRSGDTTVRRAIRYSTRLPMAEVVGDFSEVAPGAAVTGTTNEFLGTLKRDRNIAIMQCATSAAAPFPDSHCETLLYNTLYGEPFTVVPQRSIKTTNGTIDCTASTTACELRVWDYPGYPTVGTPLVFRGDGEGGPEISATLSKTADITPFEPLRVEVVSPYERITIAHCATHPDRKRAVCTKTRRNAPGLVDGESGTLTTQIRPGRFVMKNNVAYDCGAPEVECHVRIAAAGYSLAKIPISFDATVATEPPSLTMTEGPYASGETIQFELRGLRPGSKVTLQRPAPDFQRIYGVAGDDGTASLEMTVRLTSGRSVVRVISSPSLNPKVVNIPFE